MQLNKTWKLATGLMVLMLLAMPLLAVMPGNVGAATTGNNLSIIVYDSDTANPVVGAKVTLIGVHQQSAIDPVSTGNDGLAKFTPYDGYYKVVVTKSGYYTYQSKEVYRFTDLAPETIPVAMKMMSIVKYPLTVNVNGTGLSGASVVVKTEFDGVTTSISTSTVAGTATLQLPNGVYSIVCSSTNYTTDVVSNVVINGTGVTENVTLATAAKYNGYVTVAGAPASKVVAYLVGADPLDETDRKIIKASGNSPFFSFDAYVGTFTLLVDAEGALASVETVTIGASNPVKTVPLSKQTMQTEENAFAFAPSDWNVATLTKTLVLDHDNTVPGLDYAYLPSIKMQIDLVFGNGDGNVSTAELADFVAEMENFGAIDVTTVGMLSVAGKILVSEATNPDYTITGLLGLVNETDRFTVEMVADYSTIVGEEVTNGLASYTVKVSIPKTDADMSFAQVVSFPELYEKIGSATFSVANSGATVTGYTDVQVISGTKDVDVTLTVQKSVAPTAVAAIITGDNAYKVMNGSTFLHYIVAAGQNVTFTATGSSDPNGNPLKYIWDFGDGNSSGEITNVTYVYAYANAEQYTVNLTVIDQADLLAYKTFNVKVDGVAPTAAAQQNVTDLESTLNVDQNKAYTFNSAKSADMLNETEAGLIASYKWVWGDGNTTTVLMGENQTVTKTWANAGVFTMYLNVTDVANHTTSKAVTVTVKDTVKPTVKFSVKLNGTVVTSAKENQTLTFDASASSDASGIATDGYFWDFGDGTNSTLANPTHAFQAIKTFTVKLTLTDNAGNEANTTYSLKIESSARPDLRMGVVTFDPTKFTEGEDGYIYVNVTNVGTATAEGIYGQLYKVNLDGTRKMLTDVSVLLVNDTEDSELQVGETGQLRFKYSFDSKGDYTLQVNVSADKEVSSKMTDNSATKSLTVEEAAWKSWLLYGGIFAVIIVVVVLFLFRKKLPMMSGKKKGPAPPAKKK